MAADWQAELVVLLRLVGEGDRRAFKALYDRTSAKLFATVRRILRNEAAAEDAVQGAYVRIWRSAAGFDPAVASPIAWMTTIARHAAIDALRLSAERISAASRDVDPEVLEGIADASSTEERFTDRRALAACLDGLETDRRSMVLLAYCHGWSREELAARFARPVATVKTILRRSLIALKECLGDRA